MNSWYLSFPRRRESKLHWLSRSTGQILSVETLYSARYNWIPAFTGMTREGKLFISHKASNFPTPDTLHSRDRQSGTTWELIRTRYCLPKRNRYLEPEAKREALQPPIRQPEQAIPQKKQRTGNHHSSPEDESNQIPLSIPWISRPATRQASGDNTSS